MAGEAPWRGAARDGHGEGRGLGAEARRAVAEMATGDEEGGATFSFSPLFMTDTL
jgi:hypothetical protein